MSEVIFPTQIPNGTPESDDRFLFSDTSSSNASKDAPLSDLPVSTATQTALDGKVDKVTGKGLSTNDYTDAEKTKLAGIEAGAQVNVVGEAPIDGNEYARKNGAWVQATGGGGGGHVIQDEGVSLTQRSKLNFVGAGVTVTDDSGNDATVVTIPTVDVSNLVTGPASSIDNAIARFDSTTGKLVQNSGVTVDDSANVAGANEIHFVLSPTPSSYSEGTLRWNPTDKTLDIEVGNGSTLQVGQEMYVRVRNSTGSTIANGSLVYVNGSTGNRSTVALAKADVEATAHTLIGMATDDIADNADGFITVMGTVNDLDTSAFTDGQEIYLSASTAGAFTATAPSAPNYVVKVGSVQRAHATQGKVLIQPQIRTVNASDIRGTVAIANGGTGLSTLGTANQQIRVNAGATALEFFTPTAGGSSLWTSVAGTRTANTTFTVTGDQTAIFQRGLVVKWTESSAVKCAMVVSSSFSSVTTVTIVGDAMASIDASSLKYCATPAEKIKFATAGLIGTVASSVANAFYAFEDYRVLSADISVGTAGTTNSTTVDVNKNGTTMFTTKPTLASTVASSATPFTADSGTSLTVGDRVTIDVDAVQTTPATDLYVTLYAFPSRILNLS